MNLHLDRDLVFFDVEATGLHIIRDRVIQVALIKYFKQPKPPQELVVVINPGLPISAEAMAVHGLTPKDVANKPTFAQVARKLYDFIGDADLAGYNLMRLDVPILMEEFARCGLDFSLDNRRVIDVQRIFYRMEPRTLKAAYRFYCQDEMGGAHDALNDVRATIAVLDGQLLQYNDKDLITEEGELIAKPIENNVQKLHEFTNDQKMLEPTQKLRLDVNGQVVFNFGKYTGQPVAEVLKNDKNYYHWLLNKEFSTQVKQMVKKIMKETQLKS